MNPRSLCRYIVLPWFYVLANCIVNLVMCFEDDRLVIYDIGLGRLSDEFWEDLETIAHSAFCMAAARLHER